MKILRFFVIFCVAAFAASTSSTRADTLTIAVLGDSLAAGYGVDAGEAFPERLEMTLRDNGHDVVVENAGVSGDTSAGGLARLDWSIGENVDGVIVELGANDALRGLPPAETRRNLEAIIIRLKARGIKVMLAGMLAPPNLGTEYGDAFNAIYPELAEKHDLPFYPFFLEGVAADPELNQADAIHPNNKGVEKIVAGMLPVVEVFVRELGG